MFRFGRIATLCRQEPVGPGERRVVVLTAVGFAGLALLPMLLSEYGLSALRDAVIMAILALSLDFLWGRAHILSLGHAVFFGLGAYGMAIGTTKFMLGSAAGMMAGIGIAILLAAAIGYFLIYAGVRLHFFAIVTMALTMIVAQLVISWSSLTGGDVGILGVPGLAFFNGALDLSGSYGSYYLVLAVLVVALTGLWLASRSNYGKVLAALGMNEFRAHALGHDTSLYLLGVFVFSAGLAALAGSLFAATNQVVAPDLFLPLMSTEIIVWVAVGGRGTLIGPVVAALLVSRLQFELSSYNATLWPILLGGLFVLQVLFLPEGLATLRRIRWPSGDRAAVSAEVNR